MKITETSGNSNNGIRGQRISIYADIDGQRYLVDRFTVSSKYGAVRYCQIHTNGEYSKRYFSAIDEAKNAEKTKQISRLQKVNSQHRIIN